MSYNDEYVSVTVFAPKPGEKMKIRKPKPTITQSELKWLMSDIRINF
jgi:hypothetical protein